MPFYLIVLLTFAWLAILVGGWLGSQLLRQNGRILLRLDELEKRLNELEFGGADEPESLPIGSEAPAFELADLSGERKSLGRFRGQSVLLIFFNPDCGFCRDMMPKLAEVAAGFQPASEGGILPPDLRSATVEIQSAFDGRGESDVASAGLEARLTGRQGCPPPQLLILTTGDAEKNREFFREHNLYCPVLLQKETEVATAYEANGTPSGYLISAEGRIGSELAMGAEALLKLASQPVQELPLTLTLSPSEGARGNLSEVAVVMISKGEPKENRAKVKEHGLTFPVLLQQQWEISRRYAMFATPIAYLIDEAGVITSEVAVGVEPILALLSVASRTAGEKVLAIC